MRALGVHADVVVFVSRIWQTSALAIRAGDEALLLDSPVLPDELEMLPAVLEQAGFPVRGLLATHADWDHLLGPLAFPTAPLGVSETTAAALRARPGAAQRELRAFDEEHYLTRPRPLALGAVEALPVPGYLGVGEHECELHSADGHTADGLALWAPWTGVLACGDYLSPVEIPSFGSGGSLSAYRATLHRLAPLVALAETVVAGHGGPLARARALVVLEQDLAYLDALEARGAGARLPEGRRSAVQRRVHAANAAMIGD